MSRTALRRQLAVLSLLFMGLAVSVPASAQRGNPAVLGKLWQSRYNGPGGSSDGATALGVSPDGATVFVTGYSFGSKTSYDYATVAYDATSGSERWVARYKGQRNDFATVPGTSGQLERLSTQPQGMRLQDLWLSIGTVWSGAPCLLRRQVGALGWSVSPRCPTADSGR